MDDGAVQKISHMISRNDYGEGHIWIMPPTCTVSIEKVYIHTVGRAIFAMRRIHARAARVKSGGELLYGSKYYYLCVAYTLGPPRPRVDL